MQPERCDVVRSQDPFKTGSDAQRPWLLINNERHPFDGEQYLAVAVSTKKYDDSVQLTADVWETGGVPQESYVSPWAVHSPRIEDLVAWQGRVTDSVCCGNFHDHVTDIGVSNCVTDILLHDSGKDSQQTL